VPPEMMLRDGIAKSTSGAEAGTCRHPGTRTSLPDAQPKGIAANQQAAYAFAANVLPRRPDHPNRWPTAAPLTMQRVEPGRRRSHRQFRHPFGYLWFGELDALVPAYAATMSDRQFVGSSQETASKNNVVHLWRRDNCYAPWGLASGRLRRKVAPPPIWFSPQILPP